jgi:hypothetical protein
MSIPRLESYVAILLPAPYLEDRKVILPEYKKTHTNAHMKRLHSKISFVIIFTLRQTRCQNMWHMLLKNILLSLLIFMKQAM